MIDVFISHSSKDKEEALKIYEFLENNGFTCFCSSVPGTIIKGRNYMDQVGDAIIEARVFMLLCSINSFQSEQVRQEIGVANAETGKIKVPVYLHHGISKDIKPAGFRYFTDIYETVFWYDVSSQIQMIESLQKALRGENGDSKNEVKMNRWQELSLKNSDACMEYYQYHYDKYVGKTSGKSVLGNDALVDAYIEANCIVDGQCTNMLSAIENIFRESEENRVILLHGQPGHGKTTFCEHALWKYVTGKGLTDFDKVLVFPLNPSHSDYHSLDGDRFSLRNVFYLMRDDSAPIDMRECSNSLIFLDGYDELKNEIQRTKTKSIVDLIDRVIKTARQRNIRFVITSRSQAVKEELKTLSEKEIPVLQFEDLSIEEQYEWITREYHSDDEKKELLNYWDNHLEQIFSEDKTDEKSPYQSMRQLLGIPVIFRLVINTRFTRTGEAKNVAKFYELLFEEIMRHREVESRTELKKASGKFEKLAYDIWCYNEDVALLDVKDEFFSARVEELTFAYYLKSHQRSDEEIVEVGFLHRSFYQYFLAVYFYNQVVSIKNSDTIDDFLSLFAERIINEDIFRLIEDIRSNDEKISSAILEEKVGWVLDGLEVNSGIVPGVWSQEIIGTALRRQHDRARAVVQNVLGIVSSLGLSNSFQKRESRYCLLREYRFFNLNLKNVNLQKAQLFDVYLANVNLSGANLNGAWLRGAYLHGADMNAADLNGANMDRSNLNNANLSGTNMKGANLPGAILYDAN